ncbi:hypothetical protein [Deinococcus navajonensis]|uniref:Uncharacterized protein n=1 Tax=Deinococcus navajonensis TaxID=309884 RepID=A0ABV8XLH4_9DEIO
MTIRRLTALLVWSALLGSGVAQQDLSLSARMAGLGGTDLTIAECRARLQDLGTLLGEAGYGPARTRHLADGTLVSRWYHAGHDRTALAFAGQEARSNSFVVAEHDGAVRMNDLMAIP